jgi:hypothetical protein
MMIYAQEYRHDRLQPGINSDGTMLHRQITTSHVSQAKKTLEDEPKTTSTTNYMTTLMIMSDNR